MEENKMTNVLIKTLKQHTPLLHFSPLEPGATLRASEVKPKLDRYLIKKLGGGDYDSVKQQVRTNNPDWFVKKEGVYALNYQLKIIAEEKNEQITIRDGEMKGNKYNLQNFPLVLSNMGGKLDKEKLANFSFYENIRLVFIFPTEVNGQKVDAEGLYKEINDNIAEFFSLTNFGQRSGKGFGSFTVVNDKRSVAVPTDAPYLSYAFDGMLDNKAIRTIFTVIDYYWKLLKSGVNNTQRIVDEDNNVITRSFSNNYHKAFVYNYLNNKIGLTWEKKSIKEGLSHDLISAKTVSDNWKEVENKNDAFFARAHLGGPGDSIQYRVATGRIIMDLKTNTKKEDKKTKTLTISNNHSKEIARIPSPIVFKPVISRKEVRIYLLIDKEIVKAIKAMPDDTVFTFTIKDDNKNKSRQYGGREPERKTSVRLFAYKKGETEKYIFDYLDLIKEFHKSKKKLTIKLTEKVKQGQNFKTKYKNLDIELSKTDNE